jgi:hypothetical protein
MMIKRVQWRIWKKIIITSYEKVSTIAFHFSEWLLFGHLSRRGVEIPHCGRVSCLTYFPCISNKLLSTGIATIAIHGAELMKLLATVHTSDPVTVLFCPSIGFFTFGAHIFAGNGCFWFIFTS